MGRLIDADALEQYLSQCVFDEDTTFASWAIRHAPTVCCETCKYGIKGECIGEREYISCVKPHADMSNYHLKDWFCGDWKDKNAVD